MKELKLTTEVTIPPSPWKISHQSGIVTLGSCFAEVLGTQLGVNKFHVLSNPFGTIFNPVTICKALEISLDGKKPDPRLYLKTQDDICLHHDFHSSLWAHNQPDLDTLLRDRARALAEAVRNAELLVITLGTAYAYRHKATNQIIGNCHKLPADQFVRELLHPDQIALPLEQIVHKLLMVKRDLHILLTVSPVRHTRDTLPLNQVSKSTLRLVCHRLTEKYKHVTYFPSYEIMLDELRDYRFYKEDLVHPNETAERIIFNRFAQTYLSADSRKFLEDWESIRQAIEHKPQHGATSGHFKHLISTKKRIEALPADIDTRQEMALIAQRIAEFPAM